MNMINKYNITGGVKCGNLVGRDRPVQHDVSRQVDPLAGEDAVHLPPVHDAELRLQVVDDLQSVQTVVVLESRVPHHRAAQRCISDGFVERETFGVEGDEAVTQRPVFNRGLQNYFSGS